MPEMTIEPANRLLAKLTAARRELESALDIAELNVGWREAVVEEYDRLGGMIELLQDQLFPVKEDAFESKEGL